VGVDLGGAGGEVTADPVGPRGGGRVGDGDLAPPLGRLAGDPGGAHQPGHPLAGVPPTAAGQPGMDARGAVPALDSSCTSWICPVSSASSRSRRPGQVLIEGGARDLQQRARPLDALLVLTPLWSYDPG
jgi:hypothetical protein